MKKLLLLCSLLCLAILEMYGQKQPRAMVHDEIANRFMPERHMNDDSLFMRRHNQGSMMSSKMDADRAELWGRHNMDAEHRLNAVKKADRKNTKSDGTFVDQSDSLALVALYNSTNGPGWSNSTNWLTSPVSTWYGVDVISGEILSIHLNSNGLSGAIPPEIGNLDSLQYLYLGFNHLSGAIPIQIGNLTSLQRLQLNSNQLSGSIPPEIGNLTSLKYLYLNSNQLSGAIPPEIGNLNSLKYLYLNFNQLSGAIPPEIGNLASLWALDLSHNQLSGAIPPETGNLTNLVDLYLYNNQLSGSIPTEISSLANLWTLDLSHNQLSDLPNLSASLSLVGLNTSSNHLTFEDIEPNLSISHFNYSPQARVGSVQHYTPNDGDNLDISVSVGGANNTYQWYRDGAAIPAATGATYSISSYSSVADAGVYVCRIQNSMATKLTLESYCIYVGVDVPIYTVDVSASPVSSGTVSGGGTYEDGQPATVSATPSTGYRFVSWTSNGIGVSTSSIYSFVVTSDTSLVANFEDISGIIEDGLKESISIYPNPTNRLITVSGEGAGVESVAVYNFMGRLRGRYNMNTDEAIIDFTGYPSGVYLVVVKTDRGIFTRKIVRE